MGVSLLQEGRLCNFLLDSHTRHERTTGSYTNFICLSNAVQGLSSRQCKSQGPERAQSVFKVAGLALYMANSYARRLLYEESEEDSPLATDER